MVYLSATGGASAADLLLRLQERLGQILEAEDLDALLAALVLRTMYRDPASSPWEPAISRLAVIGDGAVPRRPSEVALLGCRIALGFAPRGTDQFRELAGRELHRPACPPLATAHDDDRILLGIAAGIGALPPDQRSNLGPVLEGSRAGAERAILELWARSLATGDAGFDPALVQEATGWLAAGAIGDGSIARFWMATRLLGTPHGWNDTDLQRLEDCCADGRTSAAVWASDVDLLRPLDVALLFDALSSAPAERFARQSALHGVLAVIDCFSASASVLLRRQRNRTPLEITDEYDVQDLFRALALPVVPDIEPEDPASKIATKSSRLDFTSKRSRIGFEMKHIRKPSDFDKVREEILIDEATFHTHPYVETVVAFIFDPGQHVPPDRRVSIENDLSRVVTIDGRSVHHVVRIRG